MKKPRKLQMKSNYRQIWFYQDHELASTVNLHPNEAKLDIQGLHSVDRVPGE